MRLQAIVVRSPCNPIMQRLTGVLQISRRFDLKTPRWRRWNSCCAAASCLTNRNPRFTMPWGSNMNLVEISRAHFPISRRAIRSADSRSPMIRLRLRVSMDGLSNFSTVNFSRRIAASKRLRLRQYWLSASQDQDPLCSSKSWQVIPRLMARMSSVICPE